MKVLFSNLPWWSINGDDVRAGIRAGSRWPFTMQTRSRPDACFVGEYLPAPQFLMSAAAWCARPIVGAEVVIRDSIARRESYETFFSYVTAERFDFIVAESATPSWQHDRQLLRVIQEALPGARIIVTGTIASSRQKEITEDGWTAVQGEYEKGVERALRGEGGVIAHDFLSRVELNSAPFPMYDEEVALRYWDGCPAGQVPPHLQLWTSRGCVFKCCFCAFPAVMTNDDPDGNSPRQVRLYSPEYVAGMIAERRARHPQIRSIYDDSDIFNIGDKHTLAMCEVFRATGLPWTAMCRADTVKLDTWKAMRAAGCVGVKIGMESGSQRVIDQIVNKRLDLADVEKRILPALFEVGLAVHTTWTMGLPGETYQEAQETVAMIKRLYAKGLHLTHQLSGTATVEATPLDLIAQGQTLKAYPGATREGFEINGDGQRKIENITKQLR